MWQREVPLQGRDPNHGLFQAQGERPGETTTADCACLLGGFPAERPLCAWHTRFTMGRASLVLCAAQKVPESVSDTHFFITHPSETKTASERPVGQGVKQTLHSPKFGQTHKHRQHNGYCHTERTHPLQANRDCPESAFRSSVSLGRNWPSRPEGGDLPSRPVCAFLSSMNATITSLRTMGTLPAMVLRICQERKPPGSDFTSLEQRWSVNSLGS